jgi:hypothetical protein
MRVSIRRRVRMNVAHSLFGLVPGAAGGGPRASFPVIGVTKSRAENVVKWAQRVYDTAVGAVKR